MFSWRTSPAAPAGVGVAFTDRHGGASTGPLAGLNLGQTDRDAPGALRANIDAVCSALGVGRAVTTAQVHGAAVLEVDEAFLSTWGPDAWLGTAVPGQAPLPVADALVTSLTGIALVVRVADCVPVVFADADAGVIGVAHAGRVGLLAGVLPATLAALVRRGANAERVSVWIGPHICGSCYEVPEKMAQAAEGELPGIACRTRRGTPALDLGAGAVAQLAGLGVCDVTRVDLCTMESPELFSHRRDGATTGRQAGLVWRAEG